jgi:hypothetical protein
MSRPGLVATFVHGAIFVGGLERAAWRWALLVDRTGDAFSDAPGECHALSAAFRVRALHATSEVVELFYHPARHPVDAFNPRRGIALGFTPIELDAKVSATGATAEAGMRFRSRGSCHSLERTRCVKSTSALFKSPEPW